MSNVIKGAKYIITFDGQWSNKEYKPLTIVQKEGNSYISKKDVPLNIDINNVNYWYCTGVFNVQLEIYRQEILNMGNEITDLTRRIEILEG